MGAGTTAGGRRDCAYQTELEAEGVDVVGHGFHAVGEVFFIRDERAVRIAGGVPAVLVRRGA